MRSLASALSTEIAKTAGGAFRWLVQIRAMGRGTRYLAADERTITNDYAGQLLDLAPLYETVEALTDTSIEIADTAANRNVVRVGARVDLLLWAIGSSESDADTLFRGEISGPIQIGGGSIRFDAVSWARRHNRIVGEPLSLDDYSGADPDDIGKVKPIAYGSISQAPCLAIDAGSLSTLTDNIDAEDATIPLTDASAFPSSGTVQIDQEQITYTGVSGNSLTGCTRGASGTSAGGHALGAICAEIQTQYDYLALDHPAKQLGPVYVDGVRQHGTSTTLNGAISDSVTTITVTDGSVCPDVGSVLIEDEWITYTGKSSNDLTGCTRGANGSDNDSHADTTAVQAYPFHLLNDSSSTALVRFHTLPIIYKEPSIEVADGISVTESGHAHSISGGSAYTMTYTGCSGGGWSGTCSYIHDGNGGTYGLLNANGGNVTSSVGGTTTGRVPTSVSVSVRATFSTGSTPSYLYLNGTLLGSNSDFAAAPSNTISKSIPVSAWAQVTTMSFTRSGGSWRIYEIGFTPVYWVYSGTSTNNSGVSKTGTVSLSGNSVADSKIGNVSVDLDGWADDGSGTITGTANALIERPDHVIRHLLRQYGGATTSETDSDDFDAFTGDELAVYLTQRIGLTDLLRLVDAQARSLTLYSGARWRMTKRPDAGPTPDATLVDADIVRQESGASTLSEGRAGLEVVQNRYPWRAGQYPDGTWALAGLVEIDWSIDEFGSRERPLDLPYVFDSTQASSLLTWLSERQATPARRIVQAVASLADYELELGDIARINHTAQDLDVTGEVIAIRHNLVGRANGSIELTIEEASGPTVEAVVWTSGVDVTATGSTLQRTTGGGAWDAGAVSDVAIQSGEGWMRFTLGDVSGDKAVGLSHGDTDQSLSDIDFAWVIQDDAAYVYEGGTQKASAGTVAAGDLLYVRVSADGDVEYLINAELAYTSATSPTYPLLVDSSIYTADETIEDAWISGTLS